MRHLFWTLSFSSRLLDDQMKPKWHLLLWSLRLLLLLLLSLARAPSWLDRLLETRRRLVKVLDVVVVDAERVHFVRILLDVGLSVPFRSSTSSFNQHFYHCKHNQSSNGF